MVEHTVGQHGSRPTRSKMMSAPVLVLSECTVIMARGLVLLSTQTSTKRETGRKAQVGNIQAAKVL